MTEHNPLVSVICITYNHYAYIEECLNSLLSQVTSFPYEIIVHDDASNDGTRDIIQFYYELYPDIIVPILETENQYSQGQSIQAIVEKYVRGKYVALCEGDDYWRSDSKLQIQFDYMQSHANCSLCVHAAEVFDDELGGFFGRAAPSTEPKDYDTNAVLLAREAGWLFPTNSVFMRRECQFRPPFFRKWGSVGDYPLFVYCSLLGYIHYIPESLSVYRSNSKGSWSLRLRGDRSADLRNSMDILSALIEFDRLTDGQYHESVSHAVIQRRSLVARLKRDWNAFQSGDLRTWYESQSRREKIMVWGDCNLSPTFMRKYRYIKRYLKFNLQRFFRR